MTAAPSHTPPEGRITLQHDGHLLLIGIDRPKKLNGFSPQMLVQLSEAITTLERDDRAWVGVIYAHGPNFTAGLELDKVMAYQREKHGLYPDGMMDPLGLRGPARTKPVVCAVQGICFTLGIELMLACDIVVAADNCRFAQIEVKRGIIPTGGATIRMVERAGWGNAQRYLLTGDEFGYQEGLRLGFVQEVVPAGQEKSRAIEIAQRIAEQAPLAVRASLASSRTYAEHGAQAAIRDLAPTQARLRETEDSKEGLRSFLERRTAVFQGK